MPTDISQVAWCFREYALFGGLCNSDGGVGDGILDFEDSASAVFELFVDFGPWEFWKIFIVRGHNRNSSCFNGVKKLDSQADALMEYLGVFVLR